jgi:hypothetical protein
MINEKIMRSGPICGPNVITIEVNNQKGMKIWKNPTREDANG